ncbi:MAG: hypothetical protein R2941_25795 [Desulfobacterales bacterium]
MAHLTLNLPENLVEHARYFGRVTHRDAATVLADTLEMIWPAWADLQSSDIFKPVADLSDTEILELADLKMEHAQNDRLGKLQSKGKISGLTPAEQFELMTLIHIYQIGQLRKSEGLAESVRRGLRNPLAS